MRRSPSLRVLASVAALSALGVSGASANVAQPGVESSGNRLYSYSSAIPAGATALVNSTERVEGGTIVTMNLRGFAASTAYGAHAHVNSCSPTSGAAAGPHYQYVKDPVTPSTNPEYANPANEIWLDFTTNEAGTGYSQSTVEWTFPADRRAKSVIIHLEPTHTGPHDSGTAGPRLACIDVRF